MILLTRMRLINWHNFQDVTIDIENIINCIGDNAVDKISILDALRYCLTTNRNFKTDGNQKNKRALQSSVHDKQQEGDLYLRPDHTVSYIGTEFYNAEEKISFVIVARVESESPDKGLHYVAQDWYISKPGVQLEALNFLNAKGNAPTTRTQFESEEKKLYHAKTQKDARNSICLALKIGLDALLSDMREPERTFWGLQPQLQEFLLQARDEKRSFQKERERLEEEIRALRAGKRVYPDGNRAEIVRDAINQKLIDLGYEADACILCDLLYMTDESWQDAIEACLGTHRFDIFVSPEHYEAAKHSFVSLMDEVGNISLVDTPSLQRYSRSREVPRPDELAYYICSENSLAHVYAAYLLRGLRCCDNPELLEQYPRSVTRELLRHHGYRLERMHKPMRYIGQNARKEHLLYLDTQLAKLLQQQKQCNEQNNQLDPIYQDLRTIYRKACLRHEEQLGQPY